MVDERFSIRMRSATSTHVIFGALMWPLAVLWIYVALTRSATGWLPAFILIAIVGSWHIYFGTLRLSVSDGVLTYRTLFSRRTVPLDLVVRSEVQRIASTGNRTSRLVIFPAQDEALAVRLKPFRLDDIHRLLALPELKVVWPIGRHRRDVEHVI